MYQQSTRFSPHGQSRTRDPIAAHALTALNDREKAHLTKGIETATAQSFLLWEQGYKMGTTLFNGQPCEPGVICVHRPLSSIKPGETTHYLVSLRPESDQVATDPDRWHYTCGCPFFERTLHTLGIGTCKHGLWVLRHFTHLLARQNFVQHVLSVAQPQRPAPFPGDDSPTPARTIEQTKRIHERERAVLDQRRDSFADALHGGHRCEVQGDRSNRAPVYPSLPAPPGAALPTLRPTIVNIARRGDFD